MKQSLQDREDSALRSLGGKNLREAVVEHTGFACRDRAQLHIDEAMSWESARNLQNMNRCLRLVRNVLMQGAASEEVALCLDTVNRLMDETLQLLREGEIS